MSDHHINDGPVGKPRRIIGTDYRTGLKWWAKLLRPALPYYHAFKIMRDEDDTGWREAVAVSKHFYRDVIPRIDNAKKAGLRPCMFNNRDCDGPVRIYKLPKKDEDGWDVVLPACEAHAPPLDLLAEEGGPEIEVMELSEFDEPL